MLSKAKGFSKEMSWQVFDETSNITGVYNNVQKREYEILKTWKLYVHNLNPVANNVVREITFCYIVQGLYLLF